MEKIPVYSINDFAGDKQRHFYSNDLKTHLQNHLFINKAHKHSSYIAVLFTKGSGEHQIDFNSYKVTPGSLFLLSPGQVHCWKLSKNSDGYIFFHDREFYDSIFINRKIDDYPFFHLSQNNPALNVPKKYISKIEFLFREINEETNSAKFNSEIKLGSLVDLLYIEASRLYDSDTVEPHKNIPDLRVRKLQRLIDVHYKQKKSPSDYADMMNMTVRHLSRLCKEILNTTPTNIISERIILEAKRLLINGDVSVSSVAEELGYDDYSYFTRFFKKKTGELPNGFRLRLS